MKETRPPSSFRHCCHNVTVCQGGFGYVVLLFDTGFEISTDPDDDNYGLAYSPSIYLYVL